jgi:multidrug transporter EmrE-like cation transporter
MWGMASKLFTGRFTLVPHVHLALVFVLSVFALDLVLVVLSFSLNWPLLSHWRAGIAAVVGAVWLTQHLRLVQPQRVRAIGAAVAACTLLGIAVAMGTTWHRHDRLLDEVYAPHLMPPAWRLTRGAPVAELLSELRTLEQPLRERAAQAKAEDYEP